jgi:membrane protein implicated in regulation of membrane protease activity
VGLFVLIMLIILFALMGVLGFVLKVAFAVALGLVLGVVLVAGLAWWRIRRALFGPRERWRRIPRRGEGSTIEVLDRRERR